MTEHPVYGSRVRLYPRSFRREYAEDDADRRRRRLRTAALLAVVFAGSVASYLRDLGDDQISGGSLVLHNAIGVPAMIGALVFLVVGLLTPARPAVTP